jgi:hypothetical protein
MKKSIIQIFFIGLFIFSTRTNVFASDSFYLNGNIHHFFYLSELSHDDFNWYSVGFEHISETNRNKLDIEYFNPIKDITAKGIMVKNGIILEEDGLSTWYGNFSVMGLRVDSAGVDDDLGTALLGIETRYMVDERSYVEGSIDFSIFGLGGGIFDSGYGVAKIRLNSLCTPNMGFSLGYNWTKMKIKDSDKDVNLKGSDNGLNFGVFYSF